MLGARCSAAWSLPVSATPGAQCPQPLAICAARTRWSASTTPSSTRGSTRSSPSCRAPAPSAPPEACDVLAATATWWRILLDPDSRALDEQFSTEVDAAIAPPKPGPRGSRRTRRRSSTPAPPTPRACSGACCATRSSRPPATASASSRRSSAPSRSIPDLDDAYFGIGLYQVLRRRGAGRRQDAALPPDAARRRQGGRDGADEARPRPRQAPAGGGGLPAADPLSLVRAARRPRRRGAPSRCTSATRATRCSRRSSPTSRIATSTTSPRASPPGARCWRRRAISASTRRRSPKRRRRLGVARQLDALAETDRALDQLRARARARSRRSRAGAMAAAYLALGEGEDRLGHHDAAVAAYRLAIAGSPAPDPQGIRTRAADRMKHTPDAGTAEAYRLSLEGFRKLEKGDADGAEPLLARSVLLDPKDGVARYRYGRVLPGEEGRHRRARRVRSGDPRRARLPAADRRRRLPRSGAPARAARAPGAGDRLLPPRQHALRRRRRHARRGEPRARPPSRRQIDRVGGTGASARGDADLQKRATRSETPFQSVGFLTFAVLCA